MGFNTKRTKATKIAALLVSLVRLAFHKFSCAARGFQGLEAVAHGGGRDGATGRFADMPHGAVEDAEIAQRLPEILHHGAVEAMLFGIAAAHGLAPWSARPGGPRPGLPAADGCGLFPAALICPSISPFDGISMRLHRSNSLFAGIFAVLFGLCGGGRHVLSLSQAYLCRACSLLKILGAA